MGENHLLLAMEKKPLGSVDRTMIKNNAIDLKFYYNIAALVFAIGISRKSAHSQLHCKRNNLFHPAVSANEFGDYNVWHRE